MNRSLLKAVLAASALCLVSLCGQAASLPAASFTGLYVFGDSLSDSGNNALVIGADPNQVITGNSYIPTRPYGSGDYSNASVWVSSFADDLGLSAYAAPSLAGGGDYAYGGARTVINGNGRRLKFPPSATTQVDTFLSGLSSVPSTALYVIAIGGNDALNTSAKIAKGVPANLAIARGSAAYAAGVAGMVDALQAKGATHIVVWNVPDIGMTPSAEAGGVSALDTRIASSFNSALSAALAGDAGVQIFNVFGLIDSVVQNPGAYGLSNVTDACGAIPGCDPSQYLFWDGIHPTSAGHAIVAQAMFQEVMQAVPEPTSVVLMSAGLLVVMMRRRRA